MAQMSLREYAQHRGVKCQSVCYALNRGRISRDADGWIDSVQADKDWQANTNPRRSAASRINGAIGQAMRRRRPPRRTDQSAEATAPAAAPDIEAFTKARAVRERFAALMLKMEYEERSRTLIDRAEVERAAFLAMRILRDVMLAVPDRISAQIAADCDAASVHHVLEAELRTALNEVVNIRTMVVPAAGRPGTQASGSTAIRS